MRYITNKLQNGILFRIFERSKYEDDLGQNKLYLVYPNQSRIDLVSFYLKLNNEIEIIEILGSFKSGTSAQENVRALNELRLMYGHDIYADWRYV